MKVFLLLLGLSLALSIIDDAFLPKKLGQSPIKLLDLVGQWCQGSGADDQCGPGNCECWSTGNQNGGWNQGRIYCDGNGNFCWDGKCWYPCMDKSPDTKILSFTYGDPTSQETVPDAVFTHYIDNFETVTQSGNYQFSESIQNSYTWSWTQTIEISNTLQVDVGLPDVCDIHDSITMSLSTTWGQTSSSTTTKSWSANANYQVPPQSRVRIDYIVSQQKYEVPFTAVVQFGADVGYWCSNSVGGHHFWMPWVGDVLAGQPNCYGNTCTFQGVFTGLLGVSDNTSYKPCPLQVDC